MSEPIDAVITWVDGQDPVHKAKLQNYLSSVQAPIKAAPDATAPTRFNEVGELEYCLRSLLHFLPWLRTIYIVTDQQIPPVMEKITGFSWKNKIKIIDHKEIFHGFETFLPSFNSLSIESVLWRIPNLAENFIYLNDDCFVTFPLEKNDFIREDKVVLRGRWRTSHNHKLTNRFKKIFRPSALKPSTDLHRCIQENGSALLNYKKKFFHLPHCPFLLRKKTFVDFFKKNPQLLAENVSYQIRSLKQFWPISLSVHAEINSKNVVFDSRLESVSINPEFHSLEKIKQRLSQVKKNNTAFVCLQSMDTGDNVTQEWLFEWLNKTIPSFAELSA